MGIFFQRARDRGIALLCLYWRRLKRGFGFFGKISRTKGLATELDFWDNALKNAGEAWSAQEFRRRTDPNLKFPEKLRCLIPPPLNLKIKVLEVGSGPLSDIGRVWEGVELEYVAVDPLGDSYMELLRKHGVPRLYPIISLEAECLSEHFPENTFDLVYCGNALDHSENPVKVLREMIRVVKPGCCVYIWGFHKEGFESGYEGLHQWNIDRDKISGDLRIDDGKKRFFVKQEFGAEVMTEVTLQKKSWWEEKLVVAIIRKRRTHIM